MAYSNRANRKKLAARGKLLPQSAGGISALFNKGLTLHQQGRLEESRLFCEELLRKVPRHSDAWNLLGVIAAQTGNTSYAVSLLGKAIQINPCHATAYFNLGNALKDLNRLDEALASYEQAISLKPDLVETYNNRGDVLNALNRLCEALESFEQAISLKPDFAKAYNNRGLVLKDLNRLDEALASIEKAIAINFDYAEAYNNRGIILLALNRLDEALASIEKAIAINPGFAEAYNNRGLVLKDLNRLGEALASIDQAIAFRPDYVEAINNQGIMLKDLKRLDEALASIERAIALNPCLAEAYNTRANVLIALNRSEEALASIEQALSLKPNYAEAINSRGLALKDLNRLDEALASLDQAIALKPDMVEIRWNKSLALILMGDYMLGWRQYEWRLLKKENLIDYHIFPDKIAWRGETDLQGKTLLVHGEQGLGDVIQFCRYLPLLQATGARLIFEVPKTLVSLLSTLNCEMTVVASGSELPNFDAYCPIMSLPAVFKTTVETIPDQVPYLFTDPVKLAGWKRRLGDKKNLRAGLVWAGSTGHNNDKNRSIGLQAMLPLLDLPIEWHCLQKEYRPDDMNVLAQYPQIRQHQNEIHNFSDTAALIECLDLVITVDTSVAHVAGALGKPVWILLPYSPDYRWLLEREDSPWYPSARLYRQDANRSWQPVLAHVADDLRILLSGRSIGSEPQSFLQPIDERSILFGDCIEACYQLPEVIYKLTDRQANEQMQKNERLPESLASQRTQEQEMNASYGKTPAHS